MKTIATLGLVATLLTAAPAFAVAPGADGLCGPDAPDAYKRPGGYCEVLDESGSLSLPIKGGSTGGPTGGPQDGEPPDVVVVGGCEIPAEGSGFASC